MGSAYPELNEQRETIEMWLRTEEEAFNRTLEQGMRLLDDIVARAQEAGEEGIGAEADVRQAYRLATGLRWHVVLGTIRTWLDPSLIWRIRGSLPHELREESERIRLVAEEALRTANGAAAALPPAQFATVMGTVERLQGEHARLASALEAVGSDRGGADEDCERRLREATQEITELRGAVERLDEQLGQHHKLRRDQ